MIRFIASDLDGTILLNGAQKTSEELPGLIKELTRHGIIFCAASGRQYPNLRRLFGEVADDIMYICENGAVVIYKDELISKRIIDKKLGQDIIKTITDISPCEALVSGERVSYLHPKTEDYLIRMRDVVRNDVSVVPDLNEIGEDYVKISVYCKAGIGPYTEHFLTAHEADAQACVSGTMWLDYTAKGVNKGSAIEAIMDRFGYTRDECMAFGDNFNDIEMFDAVGHPIVMKTAHEDVKAHASEEIGCVEEYIKNVLLKIC